MNRFQNEGEKFKRIKIKALKNLNSSKLFIHVNHIVGELLLKVLSIKVLLSPNTIVSNEIIKTNL